MHPGSPRGLVMGGGPHYVSQSPCPKATLAMISRLEDVTGTQIPPGDLPDESAAWQHVEEMAGEDEEIREYVERLERARDSGT